MTTDPTTRFEHESGGVRFTAHLMPNRQNVWVFNATRIVDDHFLFGQKFVENMTPALMLYCANSWFNEHPGLQNPPAPTFCQRCGNTLLSDHDTEYQFDNALWLRLDGGYGMFTDDIGHEPMRLVLCHECAHAFTLWIGIPDSEVSRWHSHNEDYRTTHPTHFGWDYDTPNT